MRGSFVLPVMLHTNFTYGSKERMSHEQRTDVPLYWMRSGILLAGKCSITANKGEEMSDTNVGTSEVTNLEIKLAMQHAESFGSGARVMLRAENKRLREALQAWQEWEAGFIMDNKCWGSGIAEFTPEQHEKYAVVQRLREKALRTKEPSNQE